MTQTTNLNLKKPDYGDAQDVGVLNDNFDILDGIVTKNSGWKRNRVIASDSDGNIHARVVFRELDFSDVVTVDLDSTDKQEFDVTSCADDDTWYILAWASDMSGPQILVVDSAGNAQGVVLENTIIPGNPISYVGIMKSPGKNYLLHFALTINILSEGYKATLTVEPNAGGKEDPVKMDFTNYEAGKITLTYADGGTMDVSVTFDDDGNPISFSNGVDTFEVVWPATTEETA